MRPLPLLQTFCEAASGRRAGAGVVQGWAESPGVLGGKEAPAVWREEPVRETVKMAPSRQASTRGGEAGNPVASGGSGLLRAAGQSKAGVGGDRKSLLALFFKTNLIWCYFSILFLRISVLQSSNTRGFKNSWK